MEYALLKWVVWRPQYLRDIKYKTNTKRFPNYFVFSKIAYFLINQ